MIVCLILHKDEIVLITGIYMISSILNKLFASFLLFPALRQKIIISLFIIRSDGCL